jgi:hypothetical protein
MFFYNCTVVDIINEYKSSDNHDDYESCESEIDSESEVEKEYMKMRKQEFSKNAQNSNKPSPLSGSSNIAANGGSISDTNQLKYSSFDAMTNTSSGGKLEGALTNQVDVMMNHTSNTSRLQLCQEEALLSLYAVSATTNIIQFNYFLYIFVIC